MNSQTYVLDSYARDVVFFLSRARQPVFCGVKPPSMVEKLGFRQLVLYVLLDLQGTWRLKDYESSLHKRAHATGEVSPKILGSEVLFHLAENTYLHRVIGPGWTHVSGFSNGTHFHCDLTCSRWCHVVP